jgi:hypothetical protein
MLVVEGMKNNANHCFNHISCRFTDFSRSLSVFRTLGMLTLPSNSFTINKERKNLSFHSLTV